MVTALVRIAQGSLAHEPSGVQAPLEEHAIRYEVRAGSGWAQGLWLPAGSGCLHGVSHSER